MLYGLSISCRPRVVATMGHTQPRTTATTFACPGRRGSFVRQVKYKKNSRLCAGPRPTRLALRATASSDVSTGIFPAGKKQAKVRIPAIHISLTTDAVLESDISGSIDSYIRAGATAIIMRDPSSGGGDLFKAAARLKDIVRGRIPVLLEDRTDIVSATQVDGVLLTARGACRLTSIHANGHSVAVPGCRQKLQFMRQ